MNCDICGKKTTYLFPVGKIKPCARCAAKSSHDIHRMAFPHCKQSWHDNYDQTCE